MTRTLSLNTQRGTTRQRHEAHEALVARRADYANTHPLPDAEPVQRRDIRIRHQGISIATTLSGPQYVTASATSARQVGAFLTVVIGTVVLHLPHRAAAHTYASPWLVHRYQGLTLPTWVPQETRSNRYLEPGVIVTATSTDAIRIKASESTFTVAAGRVSWEVLDRRAFTDVAAMWQEVIARSNVIWP